MHIPVHRKVWESRTCAVTIWESPLYRNRYIPCCSEPLAEFRENARQARVCELSPHPRVLRLLSPRGAQAPGYDSSATKRVCLTDHFVSVQIEITAKFLVLHFLKIYLLRTLPMLKLLHLAIMWTISRKALSNIPDLQKGHQAKNDTCPQCGQFAKAHIAFTCILAYYQDYVAPARRYP